MLTLALGKSAELRFLLSSFVSTFTCSSWLSSRLMVGIFWVGGGDDRDENDEGVLRPSRKIQIYQLN